jgi:hypothetical protein
VNETGSQYSRALLVGDNPFHNISHLSQDRTRERGDKQTNPEQAARLISIAVENGANGFLFSVSDTTLAILDTLKKAWISIRLYPMRMNMLDWPRRSAVFLAWPRSSQSDLLLLAVLERWQAA